MLEMVHYIPGFMITMKHVIYGAILSAARGPGERCKLPQRKTNLMHFSLKIWHCWHQFFIFLDFYKKKNFPWPFPDHSNSLTFSSFPWPVETLTITDVLTCTACVSVCHDVHFIVALPLTPNTNANSDFRLTFTQLG